MSSTTPGNTIGPILEESDQFMVEKLKRANWEQVNSRFPRDGSISRVGNSRVSQDGPIYKAYFGQDITQVLSFLEKMHNQGRTLGTHAASYEAKDGFVIISHGELQRLGIDESKKQQPQR